MSNSLYDESWFGWAITLVIAFPVLVVLLGEVISSLHRRRHPLESPLRLIRNWAVPSVIARLFFTNVLELPTDHIAVQLASTLFYLLTLAASLGIVNTLLFRSAESDSWRARVPALFLDLSRFFLVLVGTSVVLSTVWGADLGGLLTALGVGSIVIGLALQDTLGNVFAGISILFEKPYQEGDWIRYGDTLGKVSEINWRSTRLETHFGDTVIVPNGEIARSVLMNENNRTNPRYETFDIGFSYDHAPNEVKEVLLDTVANTNGVLKDPPPQVYTINYNDFSIDYQIRFAVMDLATLPAIRDDFVTRIWYAAKRHELNIPFPIRTVYHYNGSRSDQKREDADASISHRAVREVLPVDAETPDDGVELKRYGAGELVIHYRQMVRNLYLIVSGQIEARSEIGTPWYSLRSGEILGVQSMLRGKPNLYQAVATQDTVVVVLSHDMVMDMIAHKAGFARELEQIIENREQITQDRVAGVSVGD